MAVSHQHLRESQALRFNYYAATKKTASALTKRVRRGGMRAHSTTLCAHRRSRRRNRAAPDREKPQRCAIAKPCADWPFLACMKVIAQARPRPRDLFSAMPPRHEIAAPPPACTTKKNLRKAPADGFSRRPRRRKSRNRQQPICSPQCRRHRATSSTCGERRWRELASIARTRVVSPFGDPPPPPRVGF